MGAQENGLTLEAVARRLETLTEKLGGLERENERMRSESEQMRSENAELRHKVTTLEGSGTRRDEVAKMRGSEARLDGKPVSVLEGRVSRKSLLSKAGAAAVAAVAAGTLLNPRQAKAHDNNDNVLCDAVWTHFVSVDSHVGSNAAVLAKATTDGNWAGYGAVDSENLGSGPGVRGRSGRAAGVEGIATGITGAGVEGTANGSLGYGVRGTGFSGVWGEASHADGRGVMGLNTNGTAVKGQGKIGVWGVGSDAQQAGVKGEGVTGVWGFTTTRDYAGVYGEHKGTKGIGTVGIGKGRDAGVLGRNLDSEGYGGRFEGGKAQLMLKPGLAAGKPTTGTHYKGEIYMDKAGALFVCTAGDGTTVGTWKKVAMKLV